MNEKGVTRFLLEHQSKEPVSFHMPGHKGGEIYRENGYGCFLDKMMNCDITEIPGADNLFQAESVIKETMEKYKRLYSVEESYLLINGSSAGLIAAIMAVAKKGEKMIIARNCHKSVFNGMYLAGAKPIYAYPQLIEEFGISGQVTLDEIKKLVESAPEVKGVVLPSPNYYGICSDIKKIAEYLHNLDKVLIVDQAHGAHLPFFYKYVSTDCHAAENSGADIVINSTHKTLATFTQSAIVNLCSDRVDKYVFEDKLQLIESTSPSYILMASLDINADILEKKGEKLIKSWNDNLDFFYAEVEKIDGIKVMRNEMLDRSKINIDSTKWGIDGLTLEKMLMEKGIFVELITGNILMCMTGIGNKRHDYERLLEALKSIGHEIENESGRERLISVENLGMQMLSTGKLEQREIPSYKTAVPLKDAAGLTAASSIIPYPPGIPIVCPGEVITEEILEYVTNLRAKGEKVMGVDDMGRVVVGLCRKK